MSKPMRSTQVESPSPLLKFMYTLWKLDLKDELLAVVPVLCDNTYSVVECTNNYYNQSFVVKREKMMKSFDLLDYQGKLDRG